MNIICNILTRHAFKPMLTCHGTMARCSVFLASYRLMFQTIQLWFYLQVKCFRFCTRLYVPDYMLQIICSWLYASEELTLCHKLWFSNPNIFGTQCRKHLIFQTYIFWSNKSHSLKFLRFTTLESKDIRIRKSEFVAKRQFLLCQVIRSRINLPDYMFQSIRYRL